MSFDIGLGLEGTHVLVTGGGGQIGSVVVAGFLAAGCHVTSVDLDTSKLQSRQHNKLRTAVVDVTNEEQVEWIFAEDAGVWPPITCCVAVAGRDWSFIDHHESMTDMPLAQFRETVRVNTEGTFITARAWLRNILNHPEIKKNVSLTVFGSEAGTMGSRTNADYSASKAALVGLVKSLAQDVGSRGRVNLIAPGPVDTPQMRKEVAEDPQALYTEVQATVAMGRPVPVEGEQHWFRRKTLLIMKQLLLVPACFSRAIDIVS